MVKYILLSLSLVIGTVTSGVAAEIVTLGRDPGIATARLTTPEGKGPFPAVILLQDCLGTEKHYDAWAERVAGWGYISLLIDCFGPRGKSSIRKMPSECAQSLFEAKTYLSGLPFVDHERIGVMTWSQAGASALASFCVRLSDQKRGNPLKAVVAFYPYCYIPLVHMDLPLLILMGDQDDWSPAALCRERLLSAKNRHEVILKVYPGAYHYFDGEGMDTYYMGHRLQYQPVAATDAIVRVREFLARHL